MKFKWQYLLIPALLGLFYMTYQKSEEETRRADIQRSVTENAIKEVRSTPFDSLSTTNKKWLMQLLISSDDEISKKHHFAIEDQLTKAFKKIVKFPHTLEFKNGLDWSKYGSLVSKSKVIDYQTGKLETTGIYRSENKLGMKVQNHYNIKYTYDGKNYKVLEFNYE